MISLLRTAPTSCPKQDTLPTSSEPDIADAISHLYINHNSLVKRTDMVAILSSALIRQ